MMHHRRALELHKFASTDPFCPGLQAVHFSATGAVATDSRRLVQVCPPADSPITDAPTVVLSAASVKAAARAIPKSTEAVEIAPDSISAPGSATIPAAPADGVFPDWTRVLPDGEPTLRIAFDGKLLAEVLAYMAEAERRTRRVTMEFHGPDRAVVLHACDSVDGSTIRALVMPLRITD